MQMHIFPFKCLSTYLKCVMKQLALKSVSTHLQTKLFAFEDEIESQCLVKV